jgi:MscS family membrane protein
MELQILGVHIAGILAFGGFSGIAVGFASKDLLANFFGAMMIYMDKPFKVGDWISSPEKPIEGEVDSIGWRQTKIMTFEKRPIYVPNSLFSVIIVENPSRMSHRKIEEKILIKHSDFDKINKITDDIKEFLINYPKIDNSQRVTANLITVSHMALEIQIYCYTTHIDSISFGKLKQEILLKSAKIIENNGAEIVEIIATSKIQNV